MLSEKCGNLGVFSSEPRGGVCVEAATARGQPSQGGPPMRSRAETWPRERTGGLPGGWGADGKMKDCMGLAS